MKRVIQIGLLILLCSQIKAQVIPVDPAVKVSYDVELSTFRQIPMDADVARLTDLEKLSFKQRKDFRHKDIYLTRSNEVVTSITEIKREGYENMSPSVAVRTIIDSKGSYSFDKSNKMVVSNPASEKAKALGADNKTEKDPKSFMMPELPTEISDEMIANLQKMGYKVNRGKGEVVLQNTSVEIRYNFEQKAIQFKYYDTDGSVLAIVQKLFTVNAQQQPIPSLTIRKSYEMSQNGILIENVEMEKITNYTRVQR